MAAMALSLAAMPAGAQAPPAGVPGFGFGGAPPSEAADAKLRAMPTPRAPDKHPNLTGYWAPKEIPGQVKVSEDGKTTEFQIGTPKELAKQFAAAGISPADLAKRMSGVASPPEYNPEAAAKVKTMHLTETDLDPTFSCLPPGVPRIGAPTEIVQVPNTVVLLYEAYPGGSITRVIPTDGRKHDSKLDSSYNGDSVGHWEGDTLVVDVTNFNGETWLATGAYFTTEALHVLERFTRQGNTIHYEVTVEDPDVLVKPWVTSRTLRLGAAGAHVIEQPPCIDIDQKHMTEKAHETL